MKDRSSRSFVEDYQFKLSDPRLLEGVKMK